MSSCKSIYYSNRIAGPSSKHNGSVLVVDDEKDIVITIEAYLQKYGGFSVKTFTDASLALKHFHRYYEYYDLVISDIMMPEITGFELAAKIKETSPTVSLLLMSASNVSNSEVPKELQSITTAIVHGFIQKPISYEQFIRIIGNRPAMPKEKVVKKTGIRSRTDKKIIYL